MGEARVGGEVGRDVLVTGGEVEVTARVGRDVRSQAWRLIVNGEVGRDIAARVDDMVLGDAARITGDVTFRASDEVRVSPAAAVGGALVQAQVLAPVWAQALTRLLGWLSVLGFVVAGVALFWVFRGTGPRAVRVARERPWRSALVGLGVLVVPPIVALPLFLTLVGLPVALLILLFWVLGLFLGPIPAVAAAGRAPARRPGRDPGRVRGGGAAVAGRDVAPVAGGGGALPDPPGDRPGGLHPRRLGGAAGEHGVGRTARPLQRSAGVILGQVTLGETGKRPARSAHPPRGEAGAPPPPPVVVRVLTVGLGGLGAVAGLLLLLPFPEFGLPLLVAGLGALALEFDWAARLAWTLRQADRANGGPSLRPAIRWSLVGIVVAALGGLVAWVVVSL